MSTALTTTKPLPPSPLAERYPKDLPGWVIDLNTPVYDKAKGGYWLPTPTPEQRAVIAETRNHFLELLDQTPKKFPELERKLLAELGALTLVKTRSTNTSELQAEATNTPS